MEDIKKSIEASIAAESLLFGQALIAMRADHDLLIRMEEKLNLFLANTTKNEERIAAIERKLYMVTGGLFVVQVVVGWWLKAKQ